jgi:hypothetical protein
VCVFFAFSMLTMFFSGASRSHYLYAHLRPELVRRFPGGALNPDGFSNFRGNDRDFQRQSNARIVEATSYLEEVVIVEFGRWLDATKERTVDQVGTAAVNEVDILEEGAALTSLMHSWGINVRYLLMLLCHVKHKDNQEAVLGEIVARVLKQRIWHHWRDVRTADATPYHQIAADWLNLAFGPPCAASTHFWTVTVRSHIAAYFVLPTLLTSKRSSATAATLSNVVAPRSTSNNVVELPSWYENATVDLRSILGPERVAGALDRTLLKCGIELLCRHDCEKFTEDDLRICPRVKHLSRISFEEALCCSRMAEGAADVATAKEMYKKAVKGYNDCLAQKPDVR